MFSYTYTCMYLCICVYLWLQPSEQGFLEPADDEAVWVCGGVHGDPACVPARPQHPDPAPAGAHGRATVPPPYGRVSGHGGPTLHPHRHRQPAEERRRTRTSRLRPSHQPGHQQVQGQ